MGIDWRVISFRGAEKDKVIVWMEMKDKCVVMKRGRRGILSKHCSSSLLVSGKCREKAGQILQKSSSPVSHPAQKFCVGWREGLITEMLKLRNVLHGAGFGLLVGGQIKLFQLRFAPTQVRCGWRAGVQAGGDGDYQIGKEWQGIR